MNGGKQKEILISAGLDPDRNQGMIEIGDMRYIEDFFIWVNFGSNLNHCVGGNWHLWSDIQRAVGPFLVCASGLARFNTLNGYLYTSKYYTHQLVISCSEDLPLGSRQSFFSF